MKVYSLTLNHPSYSTALSTFRFLLQRIFMTEILRKAEIPRK